MQERLHEILESHATEYEVRRELRTVPPHAVYEVTVDGMRAVCKLAAGPEADPATEARVMQYVDEQTSVPVPRVLAVGDDHFVAAWHDSVPDDPVLDEDRARVMGAGLATLHAETSFEHTGFLQASDGGLAVDSQPAWSETIHVQLAGVREYLDGVGYGDAAAEAIEFVREHSDLFDRVETPVLAHGNYMPEHVGVNDGVASVVDWEHALVATAEYDYWRAALPMFHSPQSQTADSEREAFRDGYESVRALPPGFDRRREAYWLVLSVSYLKALDVQRGITPETKHKAEFLREYIGSAVTSLRDAFE